jgi:hypothetical protein
MATSGLGTLGENDALDSLFGSGTPATWYVALYSAAPTKAGGGTELSGNGYARASVTNNGTNFPAAASGAQTTGADITVGPASGGAWSQATHFGIHDHLTNDQLYAWGPLTTPRTAGDGDSIKFATGDIDITLDNEA